MNLRRHRILVLAPVLLVLVACKGRRDLGNDWVRDLPSRTPEKLIERLLLADPGAQHYYSARADVEVVGEDGSRSFKANLRVVHDSAAWISVVPALGIEVARALLTPAMRGVLCRYTSPHGASTLITSAPRSTSRAPAEGAAT